MEIKEQRRQVRCTYWAARTTVEEKMITSIAWYLRMELFRTKQLPSSMTPSLLRLCTSIQKNITNEAQFVYNKIYRDEKSSKFILADTGKGQMDGRRGEIISYNSISRRYMTVIHPRQASKSIQLQHMSVKIENMEPFTKGRLQMYNRTPKENTCQVSIRNDFPSTSNATSNAIESNALMTINFRHDIFSHICDQFNGRPEMQSDEAFKQMESRLNRLEENERLQTDRIEKEQLEQCQIMKNFLHKHASVKDQPRKRHRFHAAMNTPRRNIQINSVWAAKVDYIRSVMDRCNTQEEEHLFTFPFLTVDNSMRTCGHDTCHFKMDNDTRLTKDSLFPSLRGPDPIVITTSAVKSLAPGTKTDEDTIDVVLQWYVFQENYSNSKKFPSYFLLLT